MDVISYDDIDFSKLNRLSSKEGACAALYSEKRFKHSMYKLYNDPLLIECKNKEKKLELFSKISDIDSLSKTTCLINNNNHHVGYISKYINGTNLGDLQESCDIFSILPILLNISADLRKLHFLDQNIVVGDLHFDNIIIDKSRKHYFVDVDSYGIKDFKPDNLPTTLYSYCNYMNYPIKHSKNSDKLSFLLNTFSFIFSKNFVNISEKEFDCNSELLPFLKDIKELFLDLKSSYSEIPDVPYLDEVIKVKKI